MVASSHGKILQKFGSNADAAEFYAGWKKLYKKLSACENGFLTKTAETVDIPSIL